MRVPWVLEFFRWRSQPAGAHRRARYPPGAGGRAAFTGSCRRGGCGAIHTGWFSFIGGLPVHLALWEWWASNSCGRSLSVLGSAGLVVAGLRTLSVLLASPEGTPWHVGETRLEAILLAAGIIGLLAAGLFSQLYFPALTGLARGWKSIIP